jgi:glycosyltransferase involved in cell wall biosynthesis
MDISIVIPVKDEEKSLPILYQEILRVVKPLKKSFEIIFIDDGSSDNSSKIILTLQQKDKKIKLIKFRGWFGKSAALATGFKKAEGKVIITLDADLQDDPAEIPKLLSKLNQGYDLVCGWKKERHDPLSKVIPSKFWNFMTSTLSGIKLHDFNCGFKGYKKEVVKSLALYGELYRLIPILIADQQYKITEIPIHHRPRKYGQSKFGWNRFLKGFLDMITVVFLTKFIRRPAHFFGGLGVILSSIGVIIGFYMVYLKILYGNIQGRTPFLLGGILLIVVGIQLFSTGLLAEMLVFLNAKFINKNEDK